MLGRYRIPLLLLAVLALFAVQLPSFGQKYGETQNPSPQVAKEMPVKAAANVEGIPSGSAGVHSLGLISAAPSKPASATAVVERIRQERLKLSAGKAGAQQLLLSPPAYDNSAGLPPVGDQGNQGSCASWAVGYYYKSYQEGKEYAWSLTDPAHQFSPAFVYNQLQYYDEGSTFEDNFDLLMDQGCISLATMPYSDADHLTFPTAAQYREAIPHRGQSYEYLGNGGTAGIFAAVKAVISSGDLCIVGIPVYRPSATTAGRFDLLLPTDDEYDGPAPADTYLAGNHALAIVGYDESKFGGAGGYKIVNSWGGSWGNGGFAWLSQQFLATYAFAFYHMTDKIDYTPTALVHYKVDHAYWWYDQVAVTSGVGNTARSFWSKLMNKRIERDGLTMDRWADVTEGAAYMPPDLTNRWWIRVEDHASGDIATLSAMEIEFEGRIYSASGLPLYGPIWGGDLFAYIPTGDSPAATLAWGSCLGGSREDSITATAIDSAGNVWVTGYTSGCGFPTPGGFDTCYHGEYDAFVAKMTPTGDLAFASYLGVGSSLSSTEGLGIAIDTSGDCYVTGFTYSWPFRDAFVAKVTSSGQLAWASCLGGSDWDEGYAIAVDASGNCYVAGRTWSSDFPTPGGFDTSLNGYTDAFMAKMTPSGQLAWASYLGGSDNDEGLVLGHASTDG